jgi:hypothetical protein
MSNILFRLYSQLLFSIAARQLTRLARIVPVILISVFSLHSAAQTPPPAALQVSAGGAANGTWSADGYFSGGAASSTTASINTLLASRPAPQSVYQHNRYGAMTYTLPGLTPNAPYAVNLHFAETYFNSVGDREFNVSINDTQVLTNFDIFAATVARTWPSSNRSPRRPTAAVKSSFNLPPVPPTTRRSMESRYCPPPHFLPRAASTRSSQRPAA